MLALDALVLPISTQLAFWLHGALASVVPFIKERASFSAYALAVFPAIPVWLSLVSWLRLDRVLEKRWTRWALFVDLVKLHGLGFLSLAALLFVAQGVMNRTLVLLFLVVNFTLSWLARSAVLTWVERQHRFGQLQPSWLLVGESVEELRTFAASLKGEAFPPRILGVVGPAPGAQGSGELKFLGPTSALEQVLHEQPVDLVVFFAPWHSPSSAASLIRSCEAVGASTAFTIDHAQRYAYLPQLLRVGTTPLLSFDWTPPREAGIAVKHVFDFLSALVLLVLLSPLLLVTALAIRATMGTPVLFGQERIGLHGRRFRMWKFRSMVKGAEAQRDLLAGQNEMSGPVFKVTDDPRVTPLGRFIRKWSIDELPQLFNVLTGSMSLVGPRPLPVREQQEIEGWYRRRLCVRPGITGLWQVKGRNDVDFDEWMRLDLRYIDEWSLALDFKILLQTLPAVLARRGAK